MMVCARRGVKGVRGGDTRFNKESLSGRKVFNEDEAVLVCLQCHASVVGRPSLVCLRSIHHPCSLLAYLCKSVQTC